MSSFKVGDIVARKSYGCDVFFRVTEIQNDGSENIVILKGICYRLQADAPESDLIVMNEAKVKDHFALVSGSAGQKSSNTGGTGRKGYA